MNIPRANLRVLRIREENLKKFVASDDLRLNFIYLIANSDIIFLVLEILNF